MPLAGFQFATAGRIAFGFGAASEIAPAAAALGRRAFLVTGRDSRRSEALRGALRTAGMSVASCSLSGEPTVEGVQAALAAVRAEESDLVVGVGGGSAIDAAKAVAALAPNAGEPMDYLEVIGGGRALERPGLPIIAVPTTAGTGSEVTRNAVIASTAHRTKASLRGPQLLPRLAVVDPEFTLGLPPGLTASTGLDALTQLIEPFVCVRANPLTDGFCREGMVRVARSLRRAFGFPDDRAAREDMALASLLGGLALSNAGLGAAHGFASPVGGRFGAAHGAVCAALLAPTMEANLRAARRRPGGGGETEARYAEVARLLTGRSDAAPEEGVTSVRALVSELGLPGLRHYGAGAGDAQELAALAAKTSSMKANPVPLSQPELEALFLAAL